LEFRLSGGIGCDSACWAGLTPKAFGELQTVVTPENHQARLTEELRSPLPAAREPSQPPIHPVELPRRRRSIPLPKRSVKPTPMNRERPAGKAGGFDLVRSGIILQAVWLEAA